MADTLTLPEIDLDVFRKYAGLSLPRHVSYPMPTGWQEMCGSDFTEMLSTGQRRPENRAWSLYIHIPFCNALCKFCACNKIILPKKNADWETTTAAYVDALISDLHRLKEIIDPHRALRHIHWGGGSPSYLSLSMAEQLHDCTRELFNVAKDAEISIELDPRTTSHDLLRLLKQLGFNRLSMGVQDFDAKAQEHVRRVQPFEMVRDIVEAARELGFTSINFDLIYGLPYQTVESIRKTADLTITLNPDRIAYYHYAQIPHKIATQRGMDYTKLPDSETKLEMFLLGWRMFTDAGYEFVGLDHFSKPEELLARAVEAGTVQRNFQGMTTGRGLDLIGVGVSSISHVLGVGFTQNTKDIKQYEAYSAQAVWPVARGKNFSRDDLIRQAVIEQIYCLAEIRPTLIEQRFDIAFKDTFARELDDLRVLERDDIVSIATDGIIKVCFPLGRVLMRNVSAVFDAYLHPQAYRQGDRDYFSTNA